MATTNSFAVTDKSLQYLKLHIRDKSTLAVTIKANCNLYIMLL